MSTPLQAALSANLPRYWLRLFVAGNSARSLRCIANIQRIGEQHLAGRMDLEVVDIYQYPAMAEQDQVVAAPTLVKLAPQPLRRIIGDLSNAPLVLRSLDIRLTGAAE